MSRCATSAGPSARVPPRGTLPRTPPSRRGSSRRRSSSGKYVRHALPALAACALAASRSPWSTAAPIPEPIQETHAAVLHGRIYIAGGIDRADHATAVAYRYEPAANRWERIADLPAPRHHMPLAVAADTLYAVGGLAETSFVPEPNLWIYREDRNRWESRAPLPEPRGASGVGVVNGTLVVVGGLGVGTSPARVHGDLRSRDESLEAGRADPHAARSPHRGRRRRAGLRHRRAPVRPGPQPRRRRGVRPCHRPLVEEIPHALAAGRTRFRRARRPHPHVRRRDPLVGVRQPRDLRSDDRPVERRPRLARRPARSGRGRRGRQDLRDRGRPPGGVRPDGRGERPYTLKDMGVGSGT